tara:strand:- start:146 stop:370 length:225 start_codon:yes stop_codon:yes gene_type:complete
VVRSYLKSLSKRIERVGVDKFSIDALKLEAAAIDPNQPPSSGAATVVHNMKPCMRKLDFGAKSMVFLDENRDCG